MRAAILVLVLLGTVLPAPAAGEACGFPVVEAYWCPEGGMGPVHLFVCGIEVDDLCGLP